METPETNTELPATSSHSKDDILRDAVALTTAALSGGMPYNLATGFMTDMSQHLAGMFGVDMPTAAPAAAAPVSEVVEAPVKQDPAVPIRKSVTADYIICLEDGKKLKMLKRHLMTHYNMTPAEYRAKWGLAKDYPMVAPSYAQSRADLAKKIGLGQNRRNAAAAKTEAAPPAASTEEAPKPRGGRKAKVAEPA